MRTEGTTERVFRLLGLLQRRVSWTAAELSEELEVTDRSVRRDVQRLRTLGYPVQAVPGVGGGYRLGAGKELPPLLLDDDEATAVAVSLQMAAGGTVSGIGEAALRALAKLDQVMPPRLRSEVRAVNEATDSLGGTQEIDVHILTTLAHACRDRVRVRFRYGRHRDEEQDRRVEPVRVVAAGWRWYLMAYDLDRSHWRTFRLDRMKDVVSTTLLFRVREHPDPVMYVQESVTAAPYRYLARVRLHAPVEEVRRKVPPQTARIEDDAEGWCRLTAGADDLEWLALHIALLDVETQILSPPELCEAAARLCRRLATMSQPTESLLE